VAHGIYSPENRAFSNSPRQLTIRDLCIKQKPQSIWIADFNAFWIINVKIKQRLTQLTLVLFCTGLLSACGQPEFVDAEGNSFDWQDYKGQWLVVNFWAEWCAPCLEETPELNRLHSAENQSVLGVNFDRPELAELQRQVSTLAVKFPVIYSEKKQRLKELTPQVLPTTYVFDQQGELLKTLVGPQTQQSIEAAMKKSQENIH